MIDTAILVPQKATYEIQGKLFVYVVGAGNKVRSAEIQVNQNTENQMYVVQRGVRAGDNIVVEGVQNLRDDMAIQPRKISADSLYSSLAQQ